MPTLLRGKGLATFKNELNNTDGFQEELDNCVIDEPDVIESRRGNSDFGNTFGTSSDRVSQLMIYKDRILRHYNSTIQFDNDGLGAFLSFSGSFNEVVDRLRIKFLETKGNLLFTTNEGIKKISARTSSDFTTSADYITDAGGIKAIDMKAELNIAVGGFMPPQSKVAYRTVWGITDLNSNLILGSPSARFVLENATSDIKTPEVFTIDFTTASETDVQGKYITFNSNETAYFIYFTNVANPDEPQSSETLARTGLEVDVTGFGATTGDIINAAANVIATISEFSVQISGTEVICTSTEDGESLIDAAAESGGITNVTVTVDVQGNITSGDFANTQITSTIPNGVTTQHFYQVYRTAVSQVVEGLTLDNIDPGDEMQLVFESAVTSVELVAGEVTFEDITPESFRNSGAFLYTNPNTGTGILSANERPPIANDLELFRNSTFYSNTKTAHKLQTTLLSVSGFVSGTSQLIISNSTIARRYTFIGIQEVFDITTDTFVNTTANSSIDANTGEDLLKYRFWFDKGGGTAPASNGRILVRVDISSDTTAADISASLTSVIGLLADFTAVDNTGTVRVTNELTGNAVDAVVGPLAPGGIWALANVTQGDGEDAASNDVFLSNNPSIGQSIDQTARSIVRVINKDTSSPVNAFYLSGADDLPGLILFESRLLTDDPFYLAVNDTPMASKFNPELPITEAITAISIADPTQITAAGHGLTTGDSIYLFETDSTPLLFGTLIVTVIDPSTFSVPVNVTGAGTTGTFFSTSIVSDNEVSPNRIFYSKTDQPEAVPIVNFLDVGPKDERIDRIIALRDNLIVLKSDGIYIVTGSVAPNFGSRLLDGSTRIIAPDTAVVLNNLIYALSTQGVVTISDSGVSIISRPIEDKMLAITKNGFDFEDSSFGIAYESDRSYIMFIPTLITDVVATQAFRYNTFTRTWTRWDISSTAGIVSSSVDKLYLGNGTMNVVSQERKNRDRTDYADREFAGYIPTASISGTSIPITTVIGMEVSDVIVQTQFVTISVITRLLQKLDIDPGLDDTDYKTLIPPQGADLKLSLDAINTKLVSDDSSGNVTAQTFSSDFVTMQSEYNDMVDELNIAGTDTVLKNYKQATIAIPYEAVIRSIDVLSNTLTVNLILPFVVGTFITFKHIPMTVQYAPQHFGDPSTTKQVREGTIIFDQNNFFDASISYNSDLSQDFDKINFPGRGVGYYGSQDWGTQAWGGEGSEVPLRTLVPKNKQRCRHLRIKFEHTNAREIIRLLGISLEPRAISKRGYK